MENMEIVYLEYFRDSRFGYGNKYRNLSEYCNRIDTNIKLYCGNEPGYFDINRRSLTFPNIVYIEKLWLDADFSTKYMFPDLRYVGNLAIRGLGEIDDLGVIDRVDFFVDLDLLIHPQKRGNFNPKLTCDPLGNNMYRFRSKKGTWNIKVNGYN